MDDQQAAPKEQSPKQLVIEQLKNAKNVLVTVSRDPSVDQLAACIGLTLMMNKLDKHATAVFSGAVPSTLEFLKPEETLEYNTDSLRDFIISLDKSKADKLRYKVEDDVVKIFITPYRTSITSDDLEFTQGDFNVDAVVALGVNSREQLDQAILDHGRILHDAAVLGLSAGAEISSDMGSVNWHEPSASSLSEMVVSLSEAFKSGLLDTQIATALLTGIVSETERFSNDKTTPKVMTMSAQLMAAGANQQLIATQLEIKPEPEPAQETIDEVQPSDDAAEPAAEAGELIIEQDAPTPTEQSSEEAPTFDVHEENHATTDVADVADALGASGQDVTQANEETELPTAPPTARIDIDDQGKLYDVAEQEEARRARHQKVIRPLNAPNQPEPKTDLKNFVFNQSQPASVVVTQPEPGVPAVETEQPAAQPAAPLDQPQQGNDVDRNDDKTLEQIEQSVNSPHLADAQAAREAIDNVMADASYQPVAPTPDQDLGAQELPLPAPEVEPSAPEQPQSSAQPLPPELPPPFVPPYMQPAAPVPAELNAALPQ
jgi:hypothetical protein